MTIDKIFLDIQYFYNSFAIKYNITNPRFVKSDTVISWSNHIPTERFITYEEYYHWVYNKSQYSFSLENDSLVQLYFEGKWGKEKKKRVVKVSKASMAYLPNPASYSEYFRVDMDLDNAKNFCHNSYHVHFGYRNDELRISLYQYPLPSQFTIFLLNSEEDIRAFSKDRFFPSLDYLKEQYNHKLEFIVK